MFKRIKRLWEMTASNSISDASFIESWEDGSLQKTLKRAVEGDGNAVFFGEGSQEEEKELEHEKKFGIKKLFGLGHE